MTALTTPKERFENLPDYPFLPNYVETSDGLKIHYVDEGPKDGSVVLMMHGQPSWSYLYRKMIPIFVNAGYRAIAPDLIGFGKSDKPTQQSDYSYLKHCNWMKALIEKLDLTVINLFCQDWGGLIGLRNVAEMPDRFARVVAANTGLPIGKGKMPDVFFKWRDYVKNIPYLPVGKTIQGATVNKLSEGELAAYDAPFPDASFQAGAKVFPSLVPASEDDPAVPANLAAWAVLMKWEKPFLTLFSDKDPITKGGEKFFQEKIPGAKGQAHTTIENGGHFLQEDKGEEIAKLMLDFIEKSN